jgi:hypothetical protein
MSSVEGLVDRSLQVSSKSTTDRCGRMKQSDSLRQLGLRVPTSQHVQQRREERTPEESDEEAECIQLTNIVHARLREREHTPADFHDGQPLDLDARAG